MTDLHKDEAPAFQDLKPHWIDSRPPSDYCHPFQPRRGPLRAAYERRLEQVGRVVGLVLGFVMCALIIPLVFSALSAAIVDLFISLGYKSGD